MTAVATTEGYSEEKENNDITDKLESGYDYNEMIQRVQRTTTTCEEFNGGRDQNAYNRRTWSRRVRGTR